MKKKRNRTKNGLGIKRVMFCGDVARKSESVSGPGQAVNERGPWPPHDAGSLLLLSCDRRGASDGTTCNVKLYY